MAALTVPPAGTEAHPPTGADAFDFIVPVLLGFGVIAGAVMWALFVSDPGLRAGPAPADSPEPTEPGERVEGELVTAGPRRTGR
jgi:hypothetical protein